MLYFLLGLSVGLIALRFYWRQHRLARATWEKRLYQEQQNYQQLAQTHQQLTQQYRAVQQELLTLKNTHEISVQEQEKLAELNHQLRQNLQQLEQENQNLKNERNYYQNCVTEAEAKYNSSQQKLTQLESRIQVLKSRIQVHEHSDLHKITLYSCETDLYSDEIYEMILSILKQELDRIPNEYRRRRDILKSLLDYNPSQGYGKTIKQQIEELFFDYTGNDRCLEEELAKLGFNFTEGRNHHKIMWHNDSRYVFSFAKSPSDYRAGRNIARDLIDLLF